MARKKEAVVMVEVTDEAEFNQFIDKDGLSVVDVYQTWCGPCKLIQVRVQHFYDNFNNIENSIGTYRAKK